jgi:hypothetical protein
MTSNPHPFSEAKPLHQAFSCGEGGNSSRSEAGTDRGDTRNSVHDFIRSVFIVGRATRSAPTSTVGNVIRFRKRSEIRIYVSILKHSQSECAKGEARSRTRRATRSVGIYIERSSTRRYPQPQKYTNKKPCRSRAFCISK